ncbi:MAG: TonB-dependent receptor [candidate division WOR-3 bacterium]
MRWLALILIALPAFAFHGAIAGRVVDEQDQPLAGAQVWLSGHPSGTATDTTGNYFLEVPMHGEFQVVYQFMGFKSETLRVFVAHGERVRRDVMLHPVALAVPMVETKERRQTIQAAETPVPAVVIPQSVAERAGKSTVGEVATMEAGIQLQKRCSACEVSEVSIQGLPGRFSLILLEGMPLFAGLASRYILDLVPVEMVDRLEVVKGASGALWGSDAIAGALNILLLQPVRPLEARGTYTRRSYGNDLAAQVGSARRSLGFSLMGAHGDRQPVDQNLDGIVENTFYQRNILIGNLSFYPGLVWRFNLGGSFGDEIRRSGVVIPDTEYINNPLAEKIRTRRWDFWQRAAYTAGRSELSCRIALSGQKETGTVEMRDYFSQQFNLFADVSAEFPHLRSGISFLRQQVQDSRLFTQPSQEEDLGIWIAGREIAFTVFPVAHEILPAIRLDLNSVYGTILSPYGAIKFFPGFAELNFAAGTGFRTPMVIFESMENLPGGFQYAIRRDPDLSRETGLSLLAGLARRFITPSLIADFRLNLFRHLVRNFIAAELTGVDTLSRRAVFYYSNRDEPISSTGIELSSILNFHTHTSLSLKCFVLRAEDHQHRTIPFVRRWGVGYNLSVKTPVWKVELNTAGELNGPMLVQTVLSDGRILESESPVYPVFDLRLSRQLGIVRLSLGVNNVGDYHQLPRSHHEGRTEYYWGPIIGRELYATVSLSI